MPLRAILLLVFLIPSLPVCFARPFFGVALWAVVSFTSIQWYAYSAYEFPVAMMIAIPTLLGALVFGRGWRNVLSREVFLLVVLWVWFTITTVISVNNPFFAGHAAATWYRWNFVSKIMLMTVATIAVVDSFARLRTLLIVISGCFGLFVVKAFPFLIATGGGDRIYGPEKSMIADNNDFGLALNMTLPIFFYLWQTETRPWIRRAFVFLAAIGVPTIFFTYSRGALVGLVAVAVTILLQSKRRMALVPFLVIAMCVALVFAPANWRERMDLTSGNALDQSAFSRINAWTFSWRLANDFPIAGGGFDTFTPEMFNMYATNAGDVHGPHSIYFGVLAEHGFVGLALYLMLILSCFASIHRVVQRCLLHGDEVKVQYGKMLRVALVAFLVSGLFLGRAYFDYYFTLVACIVILRRVCMSDSPELIEDGALETEVLA